VQLDHVSGGVDENRATTPGGRTQRDNISVRRPLERLPKWIAAEVEKL
jgi:hypothetical protein